MAWLKICELDSVKGNGKYSFKVGDYDIVVYNNNGKLYVFENRCSHEDYPLIEGRIEGDEIECPRHGARFNIQSGEALCMPAVVPIKVFKIKIEDKILYAKI